MLTKATVTLGRGLTRCPRFEQNSRNRQSASDRLQPRVLIRAVCLHTQTDKKWCTHTVEIVCASESCMSVDKCTRTAGGVRIPHAVCVCHLRYVYTHARFLRCLYTYGRSLTGTDELRRSDAIAKRCVYAHRTFRRNAYTTDGLPTHRDGVCTQKCDNPRTSTCLYDILKAARTWLFPLGLYMLVRVLVGMFHTGLSNILF